MEILIVIIASVLCGILGRMGGSENWNTKFRDLGIPTIVCILAWILGCHSWWLILTFGLMFGALTTYGDRIFGSANFYFHGFTIGMSLIPAFWGHWVLLTASASLLTLWMGLWSKFIDKDVLEEFGRYFIIPFAVWILIR